MKGNKKRGILRDSDLPLDFNKFRRMANLSGKNFLEESVRML